MLAQQLEANAQVSCIGWRQLEVQDYTTQGDQQMKLVAEDSLSFRWYLAEGGAVRGPISGR